MRHLAKIAGAILAGAVMTAGLGATSIAAADSCRVCVQGERIGYRPAICTQIVNRCIRSMIPLHLPKPSPVQSKGSQIYRHFPSHR